MVSFISDWIPETGTDTFFVLSEIPALWHKRINFYIEHQSNASNSSVSRNLDDKEEVAVTQPSKFGNYVYSSDHEKNSKQQIPKKLICYYTTQRDSLTGRSKLNRGDRILRIKDINPHLCTHVNIGIIEISNCSLVIDRDLINAFEESKLLKQKNEKLKVMLWVGGADESMGFKEMVANHGNRKRFIQSLKAAYEKYSLDGVGM